MMGSGLSALQVLFYLILFEICLWEATIFPVLYPKKLRQKELKQLGYSLKLANGSAGFCHQYPWSLRDKMHLPKWDDL